MNIDSILDSVKENINQKIKTPFFGALIIVWSFHNWELLYTLFNFDSDNLRVEKIGIIRNYFNQNNFYTGLVFSAKWALITMVVSYIFVNISRGITLFFDKHVTPNLYRLIDKSKIVLREELEQEKKKSELFQTKYEDERKRRGELEIERDELEKKNIELAGRDNNTWVGDGSDLKGSEEDRFNRLFYERLIERRFSDEFDKNIPIIKEGDYVLGTDLANELFKNDLLQLSKPIASNNHFKFSKKGLAFCNYFNLRRLSGDSVMGTIV